MKKRLVAVAAAVAGLFLLASAYQTDAFNWFGQVCPQADSQACWRPEWLVLALALFGLAAYLWTREPKD